ncbi:hypothetical protein ACHAW5_005462 [Stephanodiscus triporus]|uniref:Cyclic nucleotide-binding domain-containing protein n=1 Tax=Stephanodiscus triporus TaxID=2934178 RepID=A0ABD3QN91_9STRA
MVPADKFLEGRIKKNRTQIKLDTAGSKNKPEGQAKRVYLRTCRPSREKSSRPKNTESDREQMKEEHHPPICPSSSRGQTIMVGRHSVRLKLSFLNRDIADEQVLRFLPAGVRRKILRRLYMPSLLSTRLMKGTRQHFVDSFLSFCSVEVFSPREELLQRGFISSDLYLLIDGPSKLHNRRMMCSSYRKNGDFLNELESPERDTIRTKTACKVLVMSRSNYKDIAADHPGSAGVVLRNLLSKFGDRRNSLQQTESLSQNVRRLVSWSTGRRECTR